MDICKQQPPSHIQTNQSRHTSLQGQPPNTHIHEDLEKNMHQHTWIFAMQHTHSNGDRATQRNTIPCTYMYTQTCADKPKDRCYLDWDPPRGTRHWAVSVLPKGELARMSSFLYPSHPSATRTHSWDIIEGLLGMQPGSWPSGERSQSCVTQGSRAQKQLKHM